MNRFLSLLFAVLLSGAASFGAGTREFSYFKPHERTQPLVLPEHCSLSRFGRGLFRIDDLGNSRGQLNCIFLTFVATAPEGTTATDQPSWKTEHLTLDGTAVLRRTAVLRNPYAREAGAEGDVLVIRIDATTPEILGELQAIVDGFVLH